MLRALCIFVTLAVALELILQVCFAEGKTKRKRRRCPNVCIRKFGEYQKPGPPGPPGPPGRLGQQGPAISLPTCKANEYLTSDGRRLFCKQLDMASIHSYLQTTCLSDKKDCLGNPSVLPPTSIPPIKSKKMIQFTKKNMVQMLKMDSWDAEAFYIGSSLFVGMSQLGRNSFVLYKWLVDENGIGKFKHFQDFDVFQSRNWEPFKINGEQYLVIASYHDDSVCPIYKWDGNMFIKFKNGLECSRAFDVEPFELNGVQHIAVANFDEAQRKPVVVFKWDGSGFNKLLTIDITAQYVDVFKVNDETYLGISGILGPYIKLFKWNGATFVLQQTLQTAHHPYDLTRMSVGKEIFLAVPTYKTGETSFTKMFRWTGNEFELYQNISSVEARRVVAISSPMMGNTADAYLAVINYGKNPVIYVWEGDKKFLQLQELHQKGARDISFFEMGGNVYLILSSQRKMEVFKGVVADYPK